MKVKAVAMFISMDSDRIESAKRRPLRLMVSPGRHRLNLGLGLSIYWGVVDNASKTLLQDTELFLP